MRQQTKECSVMRIAKLCVAGLVLVMTAAAAAQEKPAPSPAQTPAKPQQVPLKIQVVLSRFQGDKKLSSVPYVLMMTSNEQRTSLRMGVAVPIPSGGGAYNYRDVGTNIDCAASTTLDGAYKVMLTVSDSAVYFPDRDRSAAGGQVPVNLASPPSIRSFTSNFNILLRDGQTAQYTVATDQVSGEQLKIDATLNVLK
jgi:hypothetical protein